MSRNRFQDCQGCCLGAARPRFRIVLICLLVFGFGCSSGIPKVRHKRYDFPEDAYIGVPRDLPKYERIGLVKAKATFQTLDLEGDPEVRCRNYFNKAVQDLVRLARKNGGDAVIEVQSVTFLMDGKVETYPRPECVDEGDIGDVYVQGVAIRWIRSR